MKWRFHHKARKAFLTTAICLALSQSVFAMPTGGKVIEGDITGITNGTIASGGTINVAGSGLIDWNAFGIGAGETLNYAFTSPGTLINHDTGAKILGDIVISMQHAVMQADLYGHSLQREIAFLTVHSMLHLLGYDHEAEGLERVRMREKEEAVLTQLGLKRNDSYYSEDN